MSSDQYNFHGSVLIMVVLAFILIGKDSVNAQCSPEQIAKLVPDDNASGDRFGRSVAISGSTAIAGARGDDDNGESSGSAYLFDATTGSQLLKLLPDDGAAFDYFYSVGISETTAIVGAYGDEDNGENSGSAYLFDTETGEQIAKLLPDDNAGGDRFGFRVGISGTTAIVSAWHDDDNGENSGSAYLYDIETGDQLFKLLPDDGEAQDGFGISVAISGTTAIVGSEADNGTEPGSVYLFDTTTGQQIAKLLADDGAVGDGFGYSAAITGTTVVVGALRDDDNGNHSGSAYLFNTTTGQQIAKLLADDGAASDRFGWSVAISGTKAIVGAINNDGNGVNASGAAYLFDVTTGQYLGKFLANDASEGDDFGWSVGISEGVAIVGAKEDEDNGNHSGSAYLFDVSSCLGGTDLVIASHYNVYRGLHAGGDLSDTFNSDDAYLKFNPGLTINSAEPPVWVEFEGTLPPDSPSSLSVTLESQAGTTSLTQTIEMFNWNTGQFELIDSQAASWNEDSIVTVDLSAYISDYVQNGTGAVETRVGWNDTGPVLNFPWIICIDQLVWTVTQ